METERARRVRNVMDGKESSSKTASSNSLPFVTLFTFHYSSVPVKNNAPLALPRRRLLLPTLALGALLLFGGCANKSSLPPAEVHYNNGGEFAMHNKLPEAEKELREAIRLKPDYAKAHEMLGVVLMLQNKNDEAIAEIRESIRLKPDIFDNYLFLGGLLEGKGKFAEAESAYKETIRQKPDLATGFFKLAECLDRQGRRKEARLYWEEAYKKEGKASHLLEHILHPEWADIYKKRLAEPR